MLRRHNGSTSLATAAAFVAGFCLFSANSLAAPILEFGIPQYVVTPLNADVVLPLTVRNTGTDPFTFMPPAGISGNFGIGGTGTGTEISFNFKSSGPVQSLGTPDQDFIDEFAGVTLSPGEEAVFDFFIFSLATLKQRVFSQLLDDFGGRFSVQLNWQPVGVGPPFELGRVDTLIIPGDSLQFGDVGFLFPDSNLFDALELCFIGFGNEDEQCPDGVVPPGPSPPNPIPEPSTVLLLASGLAGLGFFRWRKKTA